MRLLITGGCGCLGTNLAAEALKRGAKLAILDNLSRAGTDKNLAWLKSQGSFEFHEQDIARFDETQRIVRDFKPEAVFHLAGQVAMTTSLRNPRLDFETNVIGGHNVLESVRRHCPQAAILYSSTNKVYGDLERIPYRELAKRYEAVGFEQGLGEELGLDFRTPYGCSKGAVDQYMLDYARMFGLKTVVFRHSSVFGLRQFSTFDQGWVGWFVQKALEQASDPTSEAFTISGNGKQVRDVLFSSDLVSCYFSALEGLDRARGQAFNIGGGPANSLSLLELFELLGQELGIQLRYQELPWRQSDQKVFIADIRKAQAVFGWEPKISKREGIRSMIEWVRQSAA